MSMAGASRMSSVLGLKASPKTPIFLRFRPPSSRSILLKTRSFCRRLISITVSASL